MKQETKMAVTDAGAKKVSEQSRFLKPPFVGLVAFIAVYLIQPLGHIIMILMELLIKGGTEYYSKFHDVAPKVIEGYENYAVMDNTVYIAPAIMGVVGIAIVLWGNWKDTEIAGTWAGFVGASLLWTGWVEFSLHYFARYLGVKALCPDNTVAYMCASKAATKPEYFLMQSSVGFLLAIMLFFVLNKETRCNMFRWMQRYMHIPVGKPTRGFTRNFSNNVAIETTTILWFFYVYLMFLYDENIFGEHHWFTYASFIGFGVWSLYLIPRLLRFKRVTTAFRYAIPTAIIFYNTTEIMGRWSWFNEYWVHPLEYPVESGLTLLAVLAFVYFSIKGAVNKTKQID